MIQNVWEKIAKNLGFVENSNFGKGSTEAVVRGCSSTEAAFRRCSYKKVFWKYAPRAEHSEEHRRTLRKQLLIGALQNNHSKIFSKLKHLKWSLLMTKFLSERRLHQGCSPMNFAKYFRAGISQNTSEWQIFWQKNFSKIKYLKNNRLHGCHEFAA